LPFTDDQITQTKQLITSAIMSLFCCSETAQKDAVQQKLEIELNELKKEKVQN
jgi:hypothetical protein